VAQFILLIESKLEILRVNLRGLHPRMRYKYTCQVVLIMRLDSSTVTDKQGKQV